MLRRYTIRLKYKAFVDEVVEIDDQDMGNDAEGLALEAAMQKAEEEDMRNFELCEQLESTVINVQ